MHNMLSQRTLYISQEAIDNGPLATALVIFAEFQHSKHDGGGLNEQQAEAEFIAVRESIEGHRRTPYINRLSHGNLARGGN
jgi:hypothetical protein